MVSTFWRKCCFSASAFSNSLVFSKSAEDPQAATRFLRASTCVFPVIDLEGDLCRPEFDTRGDLEGDFEGDFEGDRRNAARERAAAPAS
jgi:hypothetical protein